MAGGAGVEYYFGYQLPQNDLICEDFRSRDKSWDYCRIALDFFRENRIPFWEMKNANALIGNEKNDNSKYCLAKPGELYLVYLPKGGTTELDLTGANGNLHGEVVQSASGWCVAGRLRQVRERRRQGCPRHPAHRWQRGLAGGCSRVIANATAEMGRRARLTGQRATPSLCLSPNYETIGSNRLIHSGRPRLSSPRQHTALPPNARRRNARTGRRFPRSRGEDAICFAYYTVNQGVLKLTAQLYPLQDGETREADLGDPGRGRLENHRHHPRHGGATTTIIARTRPGPRISAWSNGTRAARCPTA